MHAAAVFSIDGLPYYQQPWNDFTRAALHSLSIVFGGQMAVDLFFVLSGFVLVGAVERSDGLISYAIRRTGRLVLPVSFSVIVAWAVVNGLFFEPTSAHGPWFKAVFASPFELSEVVENTLLISTNVNAVTWTIQAEMVGSLALPIILLMSRFTRPLALLIGTASLCLWLQHGAMSYIFAFAVGAMIGSRKYPSISTPAAAAISLSAIYALSFLAEPTTERRLAVELLCAPIVSWAAYNGTSILRARMLKPLGRLSYSFYLLHLPTLYVCVWLCRLFDIDGAAGAVFVITLSIPLALAAAALMRETVEEWSMTAGKVLANYVAGLRVKGTVAEVVTGSQIGRIRPH